MSELEFYLIVGAMFCLVYGFGLWDERRKQK